MGRWMRRHTTWWPRRMRRSWPEFAQRMRRFRPKAWLSSGRIPFTSKAWVVAIMVADEKPADQ